MEGNAEVGTKHGRSDGALDAEFGLSEDPDGDFDINSDYDVAYAIAYHESYQKTRRIIGR